MFVNHALVVMLTMFWCEVVNAFSPPLRPLKRLAHPSTLAIEILPRQLPPTQTPHKRSFLTLSLSSNTLRYDDTFRITLVAFNDTFYLHLRPNHELFHPESRIHYYHTPSPDAPPQLSHTAPIDRESVKAYWGEVIHPEDSYDRMREDMAGLLTRPYRGRPSELGWATVMVHHQGDEVAGIAPVFEGAFTVNGETYNVVTKENYLRHKHPLDPEIVPGDELDAGLVIWRNSDVMTASEAHTAMQSSGPSSMVVHSPQTCGHDSLRYNTDPRLNPALRRPIPAFDPFGLFNPFDRRNDIAGSGSGDNFVNSIGNNAGCPANQKVVYMGVAADCQYTTQYGSPANATTQILTNWNTASGLYKSTFNVSLGIIKLLVQNSTCPSVADPSFPWNVDCSTVVLNDRLSIFSQWRGTLGNDGAGLWHLMSGCPTGTEVGIAWLSTLCQQTASGNSPSIVSGTAVSTAGRVEWQVVSHEIGHNFGAIHDCADGCNSTVACCPLSAGTCNANSQFLMSPTASAGEMTFSQCSLGNVCSLMQGTSSAPTNTSCLLDPNPNAKVITLNMCGNGIVETGEDCDPGKGISSPCCDSSTCKFHNGAICDPESSPCCTDQCTFAPATQVCRLAIDPACDSGETCTGNSSACPLDLFTTNGQSCGPNGLACASGQCTSLARQCQVAGSSLNLSQACPSPGQQTCQVSCQDPTQSNQCVQLQTLLVDGSPCGYGGSCSSGTCKSGNLLDTAKAWYMQNLSIAIPITVAAGIVALILLWWLISASRKCCMGKRRRPPITMDPSLAKAKPVRLHSPERLQPVFVPGGPVSREKGAWEFEQPRALPAALQPGLRRTALIGDRNQLYSRPNADRRNPRDDWVDETAWNGR